MRFPFFVYFLKHSHAYEKKILIGMRIIPQRYENIFSLR